jgi:phasin family protein
MASAKKTAAEATQTIEAIAADTQKAAKEQFEKVAAGVEKLTAFNQENFDAVVKSSEVATKAAEGFGTEMSAYSKKAFEDSVAAAQDFASAKNVTELFEKQSAFAKASFEGFVKQSSKFNDMFAATAKDVTSPLNARVGAATEAMKSFSA